MSILRRNGDALKVQIYSFREGTSILGLAVSREKTTAEHHLSHAHKRRRQPQTSWYLPRWQSIDTKCQLSSTGSRHQRSITQISKPHYSLKTFSQKHYEFMLDVSNRYVEVTWTLLWSKRYQRLSHLLQNQAHQAAEALRYYKKNTKQHGDDSKIQDLKINLLLVRRLLNEWTALWELRESSSKTWVRINKWTESNTLYLMIGYSWSGVLSEALSINFSIMPLADRYLSSHLATFICTEIILTLELAFELVQLWCKGHCNTWEEIKPQEQKF